MNYAILDRHLGDAQIKKLNYGKAMRTKPNCIRVSLWGKHHIAYYPSYCEINIGGCYHGSERLNAVSAKMSLPFVIEPSMDTMTGMEFHTISGHRYFDGMQLDMTGKLLNPEDAPEHPSVVVQNEVALKTIKKKLREFRRASLARLKVVDDLALIGEPNRDIERSSVLEAMNKPINKRIIERLIQLLLERPLYESINGIEDMLLIAQYGQGQKTKAQVISESLLLLRPLIYKEAGVYG